MEYKTLKDVKVAEIVKINRVKMILRKALYSNSACRVAVFQVTKQGNESRSKDVFLCCHSEHRQLVKKYFDESLMSDMPLRRNHVIESLVIK